MIGCSSDVAAAKVVSDARKAQTEGAWTAETEAAFYAAMQRISAATAPVSAGTLGTEARKGARRAIRNYTSATIILTIIVLALSGVLFIFYDLASDMNKLVDENDKVALAMHSQLEAY